MRRHLTLIGIGKRGEVVWDDEAGTFEGTDADLLTEGAQAPQSIQPWPYIEATAATDARALVILLSIWGWEVPVELAGEVAEWLKDESPFNPEVVY